MVENFDDFARRQEIQQQNHERLAKETKPEWSVLKGLVSRFALDGKEFSGYKFEWTPYSAPEFLGLGNVAAMFLDQGERNGVPQRCRVRFARRPLEPGRQWVNETPVEPLEWSLEPVIEGESLAWSIPRLKLTLSSADLAEKIAIELSKYHTAYEESWGRLPVERRFGIE